MYCLVTLQTVEQCNQETVQDWIFAGYGSASVCWFTVAEHSGTSADRRASGLAMHRGNGNLSLWVVAHPLHLLGCVESADKGTAVDGNVHRGAQWSTVRTIGSKQDRLLANERLQIWRWVCHRLTSCSRRLSFGSTSAMITSEGSVIFPILLGFTLEIPPFHGFVPEG